MWSPASCWAATAQSSQPTASGEKRRPVAGERLDPLPEHERRNTPGEVARELDLAGSEQGDGEAAGRTQELVQRRLACDRDPDERRLERERDERGDGQAELLALEVDRDDDDANRLAPQHAPQLVAARHPAIIGRPKRT